MDWSGQKRLYTLMRSIDLYIYLASCNEFNSSVSVSPTSLTHLVNLDTTQAQSAKATMFAICKLSSKSKTFLSWAMDMWRGLFFKNITSNWSLWADWPNELWGIIFQVYQHTFCHCVFLAHNFSLKSIIISTKTKLLRHILGISFWDWDMKFGCNELGI